MKKKVLFALLSLCMICPLVTTTRALGNTSSAETAENNSTNSYDQSTFNTVDYFVTDLTVSQFSGITTYSAEGVGSPTRYGNSTAVYRASDGSVTWYFSHDNARIYRNALQKHFNKTMNLSEFAGLTVGIAVGTVVSLKTANIKVSVGSAIIANGIACAITSAICALGKLSMNGKEQWVDTLISQITYYLETTNTNVGIVVRFNSKTGNHSVSLQTH